MMSQNQQEHFMRLWTSSQPSVAAYVHSLVRDRATAEDLLQETALLLFQRFAEYDETRPFVAWALGVARLKVMASRRDAGRSLLVFDDEALENFTETWADETVGMSDRGAVLEGCIEQLAEQARRMLRLRYFEDLSAVQISAKLGGNQGSIRVALQRIRELLRECVERNIRTQGGIL